MGCHWWEAVWKWPSQTSGSWPGRRGGVGAVAVVWSCDAAADADVDVVDYVAGTPALWNWEWERGSPCSLAPRCERESFGSVAADGIVAVAAADDEGGLDWTETPERTPPVPSQTAYTERHAQSGLGAAAGGMRRSIGCTGAFRYRLETRTTPDAPRVAPSGHDGQGVGGGGCGGGGGVDGWRWVGRGRGRRGRRWQ